MTKRPWANHGLKVWPWPYNVLAYFSRFKTKTLPDWPESVSVIRGYQEEAQKWGEGERRGKRQRGKEEGKGEGRDASHTLTFCPIWLNKSEKNDIEERNRLVSLDFWYLDKWVFSIFCHIWGEYNSQSQFRKKRLKLGQKILLHDFFQFICHNQDDCEIDLQKNVTNDPLYWQWMSYIFHNEDSRYK